jgi:hypothetical protein
MSKETPITFEAPSFAIFNVTKNAVATTKWGHLAIFSVQHIAEDIAKQNERLFPLWKFKVIPVWIKPTEVQ